ncbi:MAG: lptD 1 [Firmicutes bacterium]|nr:lptD 1 [Bacillota bacterium]
MKRKIFCIFLIVTILLTNVAFAAMALITADKQYFDIDSGLHILRGNVHIEHNGRIITAGEVKTNLVEIWGSGGVTFTQGDLYFTGNTVYLFFPSHQAQIRDTVSLSCEGLKITAAKVDFNWDTKIAKFSGNVSIVQNGDSWTADNVNYNVITRRLE